MSLPLSPQVFAILGALVEERTGLFYGQDKRELFAERVSSRAIDRGFDSLLDYYYHLRYDDPDGSELLRLAEVLVVHETYLFRELDQLVVAVELLAAQVEATGSARVWSVACSTGDEPVSLAALLDQRGLLGRVSILASDISQRVLERARAGRLGVRAVRDTPPPPPELTCRFKREREGWIADPALVGRIRWERINLAEPFPAWLGRFDVILCRNVLIYFQDPAAASVARALAEHLTPSGALFVGVSESLVRLATPLRCEERGGVFFYRGSA